MKNLFSSWKEDIPSGLVVYLVALPLCLGIAFASTDSADYLFSGIIAGVVGGIVVGAISGSHVGVSGPAAGLVTIVSSAIISLGSFDAFLLAIVLAGFIQLIAGFLKAGIIGHYVPSSVVKGMLAAIGITLILKEIPHAVGYDGDFMGDEAFLQNDHHNTLSELLYALKGINPGAVCTSVLSLLILILFERPFLRKYAFFRIVPGALFVVLLGIAANILSGIYFPAFKPEETHLVQLPVSHSLHEFVSFFRFPDFSALTNPKVYGVALTIALVASVESLLSVEATDKLDPEKSRTPRSKELIAQGAGNIVSGLLGGLPVTQVVVRSSANIASGAKTKLSTIFHGILLLCTVLLIPNILNLIPLASLAAVLLMVGYKLSKLELYKQMFSLGVEQYLPFIATIVGVIFTNLLVGIGIGIAIAIFFILRKNYRNHFIQTIVHEDDHDTIKIVLSEVVTFVNKGMIHYTLQRLPENSEVTMDGSRCKAIDYDVLEIIEDFKLHGAKEKNITFITQNIPSVSLQNSH